MIEVGKVLVSLDVLRTSFLCDLTHCKGACCVEGDAGAPLEDHEVEALREALPEVWGYLSEEARRVIECRGVSCRDIEGELVTPIVRGKDCVFTFYDRQGCCFCALEKAFNEGKTAFRKPVSCHLYPIRVSKVGDYDGLNYHEWSICKPALLLGKKERLPLYRFLKEPLIRKYGEQWYAELETAVAELVKAGYLKP